MRNLQFPLNWDSIFAYVGFPAFLKPFDGGGWKDVYKVNSPDEFFNAYDQTPRPLHDAAGGVNSRSTSAATCRPGESAHHAVRSAAPFHERYVKNPPPPTQALNERIKRDCLTLCRASATT